MGFGLVIAFIEHLLIVTTRNYRSVYYSREFKNKLKTPMLNRQFWGELQYSYKGKAEFIL
jgi:hypothetical protein